MTELSWLMMDRAALVMLTLIGIVTLTVVVFSLRYLEGDRLKSLFMRRVMFVAGFAALMATANHLWLFAVTWLGGNWLLSRLMIHKPEWQAARNAGGMAWKRLLAGTVLLASGFALLHYITGTPYLQEIFKNVSLNNHPILPVALTLLLMAAIIQSAIWPMHSWLLNSLNAPTPASALMHAGLINAGGFLLIRFSSLFLAQPYFLHLIFALGAITTLYATALKLVQSDIKRMLACSTMAQMGYMLIQCGLGLFPAALLHIVCHGLFKAGLFLGAGAAIENLSERRHPDFSVLSVIIALSGGITGAILFAWVAGIPLSESTDSRWVVTGFVVLTAAQTLLTFLRQHFSRLSGVIMMLLACGVYGGMYRLTESLLFPELISTPQPLNLLHILIMATTFAVWLWMNLRQSLPLSEAFRARLYVTLLNAGQPHPSTITAHRTRYSF